MLEHDLAELKRIRPAKQQNPPRTSNQIGSAGGGGKCGAAGSPYITVHYARVGAQGIALRPRTERFTSGKPVLTFLPPAGRLVRAQAKTSSARKSVSLPDNSKVLLFVSCFVNERGKKTLHEVMIVKPLAVVGRTSLHGGTGVRHKVLGFTESSARAFGRFSESQPVSVGLAPATPSARRLTRCKDRKEDNREGCISRRQLAALNQGSRHDRWEGTFGLIRLLLSLPPPQGIFAVLLARISSDLPHTGEVPRRGLKFGTRGRTGLLDRTVWRGGNLLGLIASSGRFLEGVGGSQTPQERPQRETCKLKEVHMALRLPELTEPKKLTASNTHSLVKGTTLHACLNILQHENERLPTNVTAPSGRRVQVLSASVSNRPSEHCSLGFSLYLTFTAFFTVPGKMAIIVCKLSCVAREDEKPTKAGTAAPSSPGRRGEMTGCYNGRDGGHLAAEGRKLQSRLSGEKLVSELRVSLKLLIAGKTLARPAAGRGNGTHAPGASHRLISPPDHAGITVQTPEKKTIKGCGKKGQIPDGGGRKPIVGGYGAELMTTTPRYELLVVDEEMERTITMTDGRTHRLRQSLTDFSYACAVMEIAGKELY
ncbi:hypothetical protein Bbelb_295440 [Branchiostoma belcheri]|nr:hypothetical protein Bbelb_295440 [Branchiostoma belcheri]